MSFLGKSFLRDFGFSVLFLVLAMYQLSKPNYQEMTLYLMAGTSFGLMGLIRQGYFAEHKKWANIISWALIFATVFYFLYVLRMDSYL